MRVVPAGIILASAVCLLSSCLTTTEKKIIDPPWRPAPETAANGISSKPPIGQIGLSEERALQPGDRVAAGRVTDLGEERPEAVRHEVGDREAAKQAFEATRRLHQEGLMHASVAMQQGEDDSESH